MATAPRTPFWPGLVVVALVGACSLTVDAGQVQCRTDTDCTSRGGAFAGSRCADAVCVAASLDAGLDAPAAARDAGHDARRDGTVDATLDAAVGPYACVGNNPLPVPTKSSVTFTIQFTDFFYDTPVTTVTVAACPDSTDPACSEPSSTQIPDAKGNVTFTLDTSQGPFLGYFKIDPIVTDAGAHEAGASTDASPLDGAARDARTSAHDAASDAAAYIPSRIYYSDAPIAKTSSDSWSLISGNTEAMLSSLFSISVDPTLGVVLASVVDCNAELAAGVSASLATDASSTQPFYVKDGAISLEAHDTDISGIAGFIGVPPGSFTLTTTLAATHTPIGSLTAYVLPGTITYGNVGPTFTSN